ncbi:glycosyltransferase family 9 protein [Megalodesulfovibrio gigas]|uniref:Putative glycosyl transferase n=1 Tax=Megalodesulfovibrio gigas (strain ATCC 19364 / DSM 1382 / NCIMB 9332 / VKM B-1759) TaxID=1121448 RepID=T2G9D5_MEGG1|nr:glycosyltransferase family 9 protein [Megalodesulfovibrio gigas]AGW12731.1 putative glycosyl transferase [Megalodesulfovibrio gigas DSM 1382 = ATCC 19364]
MTPPPRTLVLNCTRFGDLLQTQPLASGLAMQGRQVGILCLETFQDAARLLRDVTFVAAVPGARILATLDRSWPKALADTWTFRQDISAAFPPDDVLNLTATVPSRLLSRFLSLSRTPPAPERGFCLDAWGFSRTIHPWASFLLASTRRRGCSPFNLVDSFWKAADLPDMPRPNHLLPPSAEAMQAIAPLFDAFPSPGGYVGLQLGASEERRRWPIREFAAMAALLWQRHGLTPVVLGSPAEVPLAQRFVEAYHALVPAGPVIVAAGKTSLTELAAVLTRLVLLVTNDTGTMHLAAGLGVDIASIFLATAQPWDTGPYRPGSLSLEPDLPCHPCAYGSVCPREHQCRHVIAGDMLAEAIGRFLPARTWTRAETGREFAGARAWLSRVDLAEGGFMTLESLSGHEETDRTRWIRLQRRMYRRFLDNLPLDPAAAPVSLSPAAAAAVQAEIQTALALLTLLDGQLQALVQTSLPPIKRKFLATWERLQASWEGSAYFNVLGYMFANTGQEQGDDLRAVARMLAAYKTLLAAWRLHLPD